MPKMHHASHRQVRAGAKRNPKQAAKKAHGNKRTHDAGNKIHSGRHSSRRIKQVAVMPIIEEHMPNIDVLLENAAFSDYISKNIGKKAISVAKMLHTFQTDEKLAAALNIKINEVRRILNVLDSYGVARYDANKDSKGWLTFKWHIDANKLEELHNTVVQAKHEDNSHKMPEDCNDFFYCGKCYKEQKIILPFDAAYEQSFKCDACGKQLKQMSKEEVNVVFAQEGAVSVA